MARPRVHDPRTERDPFGALRRQRQRRQRLHAGRRFGQPDAMQAEPLGALDLGQQAVEFAPLADVETELHKVTPTRRSVRPTC